MRRLRPPAVHAAHQLGFASKGRFQAAYDVRAKESIGAARLQSQRLCGVILGVDRYKRFKPALNVFRIPCQ